MRSTTTTESRKFTERNESIREHLDANVPLAQIAKQHKLSIERIRQISKLSPPKARRKSTKRVVVKSTQAPTTPSSNGTQEASSHRPLDQRIVYVYGRIEAQLEIYSTQLGISFVELANGVSGLLRDKASGALVGAGNRMPRVR